jgi:hypothetical protein
MRDERVNKIAAFADRQDGTVREILRECCNALEKMSTRVRLLEAETHELSSLYVETLNENAALQSTLHRLQGRDDLKGAATACFKKAVELGYIVVVEDGAGADNQQELEGSADDEMDCWLSRADLWLELLTEVSHRTGGCRYCHQEIAVVEGCFYGGVEVLGGWVFCCASCKPPRGADDVFARVHGGALFGDDGRAIESGVRWLRTLGDAYAPSGLIAMVFDILGVDAASWFGQRIGSRYDA